jgi:hypothetical protein
MVSGGSLRLTGLEGVDLKAVLGYGMDKYIIFIIGRLRMGIGGIIPKFNRDTSSCWRCSLVTVGSTCRIERTSLSTYDCGSISSVLYP